MKQRMLGRTGIQVGEIGMGCEGFVGKSAAEVAAFVDEMERTGVNCIDLYTPDAQLRTNLGLALAGRRERFVLQGHLCTIWKEEQYKRTRQMDEIKQGFTDLLERLQTNFIEIGMIHYVDSMPDWELVKAGPIMAYAQQLKAAGTIGCIGLSSHNPEVALAAVESGLIGVLMFSINPCYDLQPAHEDVEQLWNPENYAQALVNLDPQRERLYETCQRLGVGITVMKAFGGGDLLRADLSPAGVALTATQCLHYALTRPAVACVMSGARTPEELQQSVAYEHASDAQKDYAEAFAAMPKISWEGHCMYCGHCAPCPQSIDIAAVTKFLNLCKAQGEVPETVREHYALLPAKAGQCVGCGACEKRCPFHVPVIQNMQAAKKTFGK
ncbi:MAG: aldo/keto reductase [Anaerotruncus sp.]|nr:aldo/keto reductase [Anaerotruncus sp.]